MTTDNRVVSDAEVRAAAERWARAAGVPVSVAVGALPRTPPVGARFLRGLLLGASLWTLLLVGSAAGAVPVLWVLFGAAVASLATRMALHRRQARTVAGR